MTHSNACWPEAALDKTEKTKLYAISCHALKVGKKNQSNKQ